MLDTAWCESLARALPPAAFLTAPEDTRPYECDGLSAYRRTPARRGRSLRNAELPQRNADFALVFKGLQTTGGMGAGTRKFLDRPFRHLSAVFRAPAKQA